MEYITLENTDLKVSKIGLGMMRIGAKPYDEVEALLLEALNSGINFFDHADIYGNGKSEELFGQFLQNHPELREKMIVQTKCDIVTANHGGPRYDTSADYIKSCVEHSLQRLHTDYIDILLLHRPDPLWNPKDIAQVFNELKQEGKVRYFGVSNFSASKMASLQKQVNQPLLVNQIQLSIVHSSAIDRNVFFNMNDPHAINYDDGILDYCYDHNVLVQPWCPLQASWQHGCFIDNPIYPKLNEVLESLANQYQVSKSAISLAWLLKLPNLMQPIIGTTSVEHLKESLDCLKVNLTHQQWYDLYCAKGIQLP